MGYKNDNCKKVDDLMMMSNNLASMRHLVRTYGFWYERVADNKYVLYHEQTRIAEGSLQCVYAALSMAKHLLEQI